MLPISRDPFACAGRWQGGVDDAMMNSVWDVACAHTQRREWHGLRMSQGCPDHVKRRGAVWKRKARSIASHSAKKCSSGLRNGNRRAFLARPGGSHAQHRSVKEIAGQRFSGQESALDDFGDAQHRERIIADAISFSVQAIGPSHRNARLPSQPRLRGYDMVSFHLRS